MRLRRFFIRGPEIPKVPHIRTEPVVNHADHNPISDHEEITGQAGTGIKRENYFRTNSSVSDSDAQPSESTNNEHRDQNGEELINNRIPLDRYELGQTAHPRAGVG